MDSGFKINKAYAQKYDTWRQKEELQKLKNKYGDEDESDDSSSSESEDENAEALTEQLDKDWLRTLSALKSKDPIIYQKDVKFYHDDDEDSDSGDDDDGDKKKSSKKEKKSKDKPMYLKDYERKILLEKGGVVDEEEERVKFNKSSNKTLSYQQEQEQLRKNVVAAAGDDSDDDDDDDSDDDDSGLLKKREKTDDERRKEEYEYLEWMKGQKSTLEKDKNVAKDLEGLKKYWEKKDLDDGEKFLKNYILNRQYLDKDDDEYVPSYDDIVNENEEENLSEEEELLVKQDDFERKYNFRFEEPDAAEVKTFPRQFEDSLRRKDTKRTEKRKETKERKKMEKEKKKEELKQLKKLKRQEILSKIEKLKQITGNKHLGFNEEELDDDFDPEKHDKMMEGCFNDDYYDAGEDEEVKPIFKMSDDEGEEDWDNWDGGGDEMGGQGSSGYNEEYNDWNNEPNVDDPDFIMDADYDPEADRLRKKMKKERKKKHKLSQALQTKKPVFDPNEKTFEEYFDEYYKLDYEDIIDDMPCRYKYRKVVPNNFGLTVDEILKCRDKELNSWVSVKKASQYRTEEEELRDVEVYGRKARNERKKRNILISLYQTDDKDEETDVVTNKPGQTTADNKKGKKKRKRKGKKKAANDGTNIDKQSGNKVGSDASKAEGGDKVTGAEKDKSKNVEVRNSAQDKNDGNIKYGKKRKAESESNVDNTEDDNVVNSESVPKKKKKKKHSLEHEDESKSVNESLNTEVNDNRTESTLSDRVKDGVEESNKTEGRKKKKKNKKNKKKGDQKLEMSEERLKAYGINPKKYKYMKKDEMFQMKPKKNKQFS
ncbi:KRRI-Interacting protein 1 [Mactra antiquata]